jgi:hypothetical protein
MPAVDRTVVPGTPVPGKGCFLSHPAAEQPVQISYNKKIGGGSTGKTSPVKAWN